jgi:hypothetical protein
VLSRDGFSGKVHVRWYKVTNDAPNAAWVRSLAARNPPPAAVVGGWSSDRARELAEAMAAGPWPGPKPLLLLSTATADVVYPDEESYAVDYQPPKLIGLYDRSFRFCFTNRQMAAAVTDFVFADPTLRPGPAVWPELLRAGGRAGGADPLPWLADLAPGAQRAQAFAVAWKDDPYSLDLAQQFREAIAARGGAGGHAAERRGQLRAVQHRAVRAAEPARGADRRRHPRPPRVPEAGRPHGAGAADGHRPGPAGAGGAQPGCVRAGPAAGRVTGDGIPVNALFRDGEFAWPVRALPGPLGAVHPRRPIRLGPARRGAPPPAGYELAPPARPGAGRHTTEDVQLFTTMARAVARGAFADGTGRVAAGADELHGRFRALAPAVFDPAGNRASGSGEHVVVLRPTPRVDGVVTYPDATLEVWTRGPGRGWARCTRCRSVQTARPNDGSGE